MAKKPPLQLGNVAQGRIAKMQPGVSVPQRINLGAAGVDVPIVMKSPGSPTASGLDFSGVDPPVRRYSADLAWLTSGSQDFKLVFAQQTLDMEAIDTALVVRLNPAALLQYIESMERFVNPSVEEIAEAMLIEEEPVEPEAGRPNQVARAVANIIITSVSGFETCLDIFHASPPALMRMQQEHKLSVEPVVRVDLKTSIFLSLLRKIEAGSV